MLWYTARSPRCTSTFPVAKKNNEEASAMASHYVWDWGLESTSEYEPGKSFQICTKSLILPSDLVPFQMDDEEYGEFTEAVF